MTRDFLEDLSRSRARQGFTPTDTALFVFSLKEPLFARMRTAIKDADELGTAIWDSTLLLDALGLYTMEAFQRSREEIISRQQQEMLELSTPVTQLWDGILAVPLVGTLDSARTQVVMESLLEEIVTSGASIAVMDITGVPTVDTLVAQHLLKTVAAAKLMGAECIISGIRPQIAQTIVHLGVDLGDVVTKATLADAFRHALARVGLEVCPKQRPLTHGEDSDSSNGAAAARLDSGRPARPRRAAAARGPHGADRRDGRERRTHRHFGARAWSTRSSVGC